MTNLCLRLVEECITHLIQSTQQGKKATKVFESLHPYYQQSSYGGSVGFSEARALRVTFNPQCSTQGRDASAPSSIGRKLHHEIASFSGTAGWRPFIVRREKFISSSYHERMKVIIGVTNSK